MSMKQAFEASRRSFFMMDPASIVVIGVDTEDGPEHPLYDARIHRPLNEATVRDMMRRGVKEPISVTKDGAESPPIVVDGRRRVLHAREATRRLREEGHEVTIQVPVLPPERGDNGRMLGLMVALNEHREEDSPLNRARKLQRYLDMGYTEQDAADTFAVSVQTIQNYLKLLSLHPQCMKAIEEGQLAPSAGYQLAAKPQAEQRALLEKLTKGGKKKATIRDTEGVLGKKDTRPSKALLRAVVNQGKGRVSDEFRLGIEFAMGVVEVNEVEGLQALLAELKK